MNPVGTARCGDRHDPPSARATPEAACGVMTRVPEFGPDRRSGLHQGSAARIWKVNRDGSRASFEASADFTVWGSTPPPSAMDRAGVGSPSRLLTGGDPHRSIVRCDHGPPLSPSAARGFVHPVGIGEASVRLRRWAPTRDGKAGGSSKWTVNPCPSGERFNSSLSHHSSSRSSTAQSSLLITARPWFDSTREDQSPRELC